jgi:putative tricarboxylic transport membrane protein
MTELFSSLGDGFAQALTPENIAFSFLGVLIGTVVGVIPGIGPTTAIALLIPVSFGMDPVSGLILLCGIYYGSMYGGSITSILIRTPGEIASVVTALDGYEMTRRGRAGPALATAAIGSFVAGTLSTVGLMVLAPALASIAVAFGAAEYFLLLLLALLMTSNLSGGSRLKAAIATVFGMSIAVVGIDPQASMPRMTLGILELNDGVDFAIFAMALFAIPEALKILTGKEPHAHAAVGRVRVSMSRSDWRRSAAPWFRGSILGFFVGLLPGIGTLGSFMSYPLEKKLSKHPEEFGKGAIEAVAGPEAANNAGVGGGMVPLFTLGIPGSPTTALLLFVFTMYGLQPGPQLMQNESTLIWAIIASMYVGNLVLLLLNLPFVGLFVKLLKIPEPMLFGGVLAFVVLGAYTLGFNLFSMVVVLVFGLVGYGMQKYGFPVAPAVLGLVLEPLIETSLRRALQISGGDPATFVDSPMAAVLTALLVLVLVGPLLLKAMRRRGKGLGVIGEALEGSDEEDHLARASAATSPAGPDTDGSDDTGKPAAGRSDDGPSTHTSGPVSVSRGTGAKES